MYEVIVEDRQAGRYVAGQFHDAMDAYTYARTQRDICKWEKRNGWVIVRGGGEAIAKLQFGNVLQVGGPR